MYIVYHYYFKTIHRVITRAEKRDIKNCIEIGYFIEVADTRCAGALGPTRLPQIFLMYADLGSWG